MTEVPRFLLEDAQRFYASGAAPATPRRAATVLLLRPPYQVYLLRRAATMAFAPGLYAFPGGSVDLRDAQAALEWIGPAPDDWATRMALPAGEAQAVVCAAVREVFEESGVLLAAARSGAPVDVSTVDWEEARHAVETRQLSFAALLKERGLALRADLLALWSRWLTPEFEPRRFDTFFFLARLPAGQSARQVGAEASQTTWSSPAAAAALPMLPPTRMTLRQLAGFDRIDAALAAAAGRDVATPIEPRLVDGRLVVPP